MVVLGADADRARADAHAAWDELLDTLVDFRVPVDRTETPRATADRLVRETLTDDTAAVGAARLLGRAEERARYARDPLTGERLHPALRAVRGALAARADRRTRLLAAVLPPSVLLRWRLRGRRTRPPGWWRGRRGPAPLLRWNPRRLLADRRPLTDAGHRRRSACWTAGPGRAALIIPRGRGIKRRPTHAGRSAGATRRSVRRIEGRLRRGSRRARRARGYDGGWPGRPGTRRRGARPASAAGQRSAVPLRALPPPVLHAVQERRPATGAAARTTATRRAAHHVQVG